jgi:hypothetical protein
MAYLKIKNKKDSISNFLGPVANLNDSCIIKINKDKIECILASADATIACKAVSNIETDITGENALNIPDIKKLIRVLDIIPEAEIQLNLNNNSISYNDKGYKFKYHLLDDGIIKQPALNFSKINQLDFDLKFTIKERDLNTLFKGSSFATETSKIYIYEEEGKIFGELGDRNRHNTDNFVCILSDVYEGNLIKPLPINFDSFRLISFNNSKDIKFNINTEMGVITCTFQKGDTSLIYIISALIN